MREETETHLPSRRKKEKKEKSKGIIKERKEQYNKRKGRNH